MKKVSAFLTFFVLMALVGTSYAWEGRMAGMEKPYGLIEDESDFLTHPAKIASSGDRVKYYLDYQFTFTDITHWRYKLDQVDLLHNNALDSWRFNSPSAHDYDHNSLLGVLFH